MCLAITKKDTFEVSLAKLTEIGIKKISPILSKRIIKNNLNYERLNKIMKESTEQSEQIEIPILNEIKKFEEHILSCKQNKKNIILCDISGQKDIKIKENTSIFIGPEGGFSEDEIEFAKKNGANIMKISDNIFRAETAAIIMAYIIKNNEQ